MFWLFFPHKKFPKLYVLPSKDINNRSIPAPAFSLFGILSALLKTSSSFSSGGISITSLVSCMNIDRSGNILASSSSVIYVSDTSSFTIYTYVFDIRYYASILLSDSLLSYLSYIRKTSCLQFLLQTFLQVFLCRILCLRYLSCRTKLVFLVPTQTINIGQRWVVSQFFLVPLPSLQLQILWVIIPNHCCEYISRCTATWISVLHIYSIPLRKYWGCFFSSMCFLCLCMTWHRIQRKIYLC